MRKRIWDRIKDLLPTYSWGPLVACFMLNVFGYYIPRVVNHLVGAQYHDLALPIDDKIPFVPAFILVYVASYVTWYLGYALICREHPKNSEVIFADVIAKTLCMVIFMLYPTSIQRPEVTGSGFLPWLVRFIYAADSPDNLFPSIHCLESWIVFRGMLRCRRVGSGVKAGYLVLALLVFASTVLVKQHVVADIPAGMLAGEIGLMISHRLKLGDRYAAWCTRKMEAA